MPPEPTNGISGISLMTLANTKLEMTIPAIQQITIIQEKKLAMLYMTREALSINKSPLIPINNTINIYFDSTTFTTKSYY